MSNEEKIVDLLEIIASTQAAILCEIAHSGGSEIRLQEAMDYSYDVLDKLKELHEPS